MTDSEKLIGIREAITKVRQYPPEGHPRRDEEGYPMEFSYDEYAYRRMVDSIRTAIDDILKEYA